MFAVFMIYHNNWSDKQWEHIGFFTLNNRCVGPYRTLYAHYYVLLSVQMYKPYIRFGRRVIFMMYAGLRVAGSDYHFSYRRGRSEVFVFRM